MFSMLFRQNRRVCIQLNNIRNISLTKYVNQKKVAVILSGSGVYDGTEIHEAAAVCVHLTKHDYNPCFFAPERQQLHVIDHSKGEVSGGEKRCVLAESARIARGDIKPLSQLNVTDYSAVVFPGGFGAAKNLSSFATDGASCKIADDITDVLNKFHSCKKPIGLVCIAPILAAKTIPNVTITLGSNNDENLWPHSGAIEAAKQMGASVESKNFDEVCVDRNNLVVTSPAFMYNGKFCQIFDGIGNMIVQLHKLIQSTCK